MDRNKLLIGNWKLNPTSLTQAKSLAKEIIKLASPIRGVDFVLCPSTLHVATLKSDYRGKKVSFGAQDISLHVEGAHTGDVSVKQLTNLGLEYVIIGHSERRANRQVGGYDESDSLIAQKVRLAVDNKITPIVCIGETQRSADGQYLQEIKDQLYGSLETLRDKDLAKIIIAYEPVWAIGKGIEQSITGHDLHEMYLYLHKLLTERWGVTVAKKVRIIYGGSVKPGNASFLSAEGMMAGFLVGSASMDAKDFIAIAKSM